MLLLALAAMCNLTAWKQTSRLSQKLLAEIVRLEPSPPPNALYIFHNLPRTIRGVFFYQAGLQEAINLAYNREDLRAMRVEGPVSTASETYRTPVVRWEWGENGIVLKRGEGN